MQLIFFAVALLFVFAVTFIKRDRILERQILSVLLRHGEMYGLQIIDAIEQDYFREPGFGELYPTLRRLERDGIVTARWEEERPLDRGGARRRYYRLTGKRFQLEEPQTGWQHLGRWGF